MSERRMLLCFCTPIFWFIVGIVMIYCSYSIGETIGIITGVVEVITSVIGMAMFCTKGGGGWLGLPLLSFALIWLGSYIFGYEF